MTDTQTPNPESEIASNDPGDETSNRYRYQWTWAAIVCCKILDDSDDIEEVFCEHHEDVLIKHRDGSYTGHQVKTRDEKQSPWKANDSAVLLACERFAKLEFEFPDCFRQFCFLTNHTLHSGENYQSLPYVLNLIKQARSIEDLHHSINSWVHKIAQSANVSDLVTFKAMSKTTAKSDLPKLQDAFMRLMNTITQCWSPATECSFESIKRVAQAMIDECSRASSLHHKQLLSAYLLATGDDNSLKKAQIEGKRMTLARVNTTLEYGRDSCAILTNEPIYFDEPGKGSSILLKKKLDAGGFSIVSSYSAEDLRTKADYLAITWTKKYGKDKGLKRYNHICSLVWSDAGRAFDLTQKKDNSFGPAMREKLCLLIHERRKAGHQLFDSTDDHLEGFAFSLTAQCKIVWSHCRPWEHND